MLSKFKPMKSLILPRNWRKCFANQFDEARLGRVELVFGVFYEVLFQAGDGCSLWKLKV
jgi:hypothetical protein